MYRKKHSSSGYRHWPMNHLKYHHMKNLTSHMRYCEKYKNIKIIVIYKNNKNKNNT